MTGATEGDFSAAIDEYWHGRPPSCLEDVLTLYGVLATAEDGSELFRTSTALDDFVDKGRIVTIHVDLTGDTPAYVETTVDRLRQTDVPRLGYAAKSSGRGADYSISQSGSVSGNAPSKLADTHLGRIRRWTEYDSVQSVVDDHPDGWVVSALARAFERDSATIADIATDIEARLSGDEPTVLTVAMEIDTVDLADEDDRGVETFFPGDLGVLETAMQRYKTANMTDKHLSGARTSEGQATGLVTGSEGHVVGTPESPLDTFSIKHPDVQPGLRRTASWRNYPIDEQTGQLIAKGADLVERCVFRVGGMETYALPYFASELTAGKADLLYSAIRSLDPDDEGNEPPMAQVTYDLVESDYEEVRALADELRFYYITLPIGDDTHVVAEGSAVTTYWVNEIAKALVETIQGATARPELGGVETSVNWPLLDFPADTRRARKLAFTRIVGYDFVDATFARRDDEVADDFRRVATQRLIEGQPLDAQVLFEEYVTRLGDAFDGDPPPWQIPAMQFVQFEALVRAGLVDDYDTAVAPDHTDMTTTDATDIATIREERLEQFLNRPMFAADEDTSVARRAATERRAAFLSGVFIGQVSWHQENERSMGRTLDARTQADKLTARVLEQTIRTALDNARIYASESEYDSDILYPEVSDRLLDALERQPTDWALEKSELQFLVALGQSYGRRAMPIAFDLRTENTPTDSTADQQSTESNA
jgi:CRISPR-associated protein Cas8b/Csh1 subtype I-B